MPTTQPAARQHDDTGQAANDQPCRGCGTPSPYGAPCGSCVACVGCAAIVAYVATVDTGYGDFICGDCQQRRFWQCDGCYGWNRNGQLCPSGCGDTDDDCDYGCRCVDCTGDGGYLLHDYSYKPDPVFHGTGPVYLGPEIEVETPDGAIDRCVRLADRQLGGLGYLKLDSSIGCGFEIVTHPMAYDWAIEHFPWPMLGDLADAGCEATYRTGMHVHVSRAGFASPCHTYRWLKFIYRNQRQVTTLARRNSAAWAAFTDYDRQAVKYYAKGARGDRYRAVNTNNPDTFELRVFASSLDPNEVQAALAFTASSVEYTRTLTAHTITTGGGWTWAAYVDWLTRHPAYQPLSDQLETLRCVC